MKTAFYRTAFAIAIIFCISYCNKAEQYKAELEEIEDAFAQHRDTLPALNIENVYAELVRNNANCPDIVLSQAVLETGWFSSAVAANYNNLFGLYDSHSKDYYQFSHWTESCKAYVELVQHKQRRYNCKDYYDFLRQLGYAEDPNYIAKVKRVHAKLKRTYKL